MGNPETMTDSHPRIPGHFSFIIVIIYSYLTCKFLHFSSQYLPIGTAMMSMQGYSQSMTE